MKSEKERLDERIFIEQSSLEPKVKAYIPMYELLETVICKKCGKVVEEPKNNLTNNLNEDS